MPVNSKVIESDLPVLNKKNTDSDLPIIKKKDGTDQSTTDLGTYLSTQSNESQNSNSGALSISPGNIGQVKFGLPSHKAISEMEKMVLTPKPVNYEFGNADVRTDLPYPTKSKVIQATIADPTFASLTSKEKKNIINTKLIENGFASAEKIAQEDAAEAEKITKDEENATKDIGITIADYEKKRNSTTVKHVYFEGETYDSRPIYHLNNTDYSILPDGRKVKFEGDKWVGVNNAEAQQLDYEISDEKAQKDFKSVPQNITKNLFNSEIDQLYVNDVNKYLYHLKETQPDLYDQYAEKVLLYRGENLPEKVNELLGGDKRKVVNQDRISIQGIKQRLIGESQDYKLGGNAEDLDVMVNRVGGPGKIQEYLQLKAYSNDEDINPIQRDGYAKDLNAKFAPEQIADIENAIGISKELYDGRNKIDFANQNIVKDVYKQQVFQRAYDEAAKQEKSRYSQVDAGKSVWNASLSASNGVVQLPKRLDFDNEYGLLDLWSDSFNESANDLKAVTANRTLYDSKTGEWDGSAFLPLVTGGLTSMTLLAGGGLALGRATGIGNAGVVASGFTIQHNDYYEQALNSGEMTPQQANLYAIAAAGLTSMLELVSPGEKIFGKAGLEYLSTKAAMKEFASGKSLNEILDAKGILKEMSHEMLQEGTQDVGDRVANTLTNNVIGKDALNTDYTLNDFTETMATTAAVTFLAGGFKGMVSRGQAREEIVNRLAGNNLIDLTLQSVQNNVDAGIISEDKAFKLTEELTKRNSQINALPKEYGDAKKDKIIELQNQLLPYQKQEYSVGAKGEIVKNEPTPDDKAVITKIQGKIADLSAKPNDYFDNELKTQQQRAAELLKGNPASVESILGEDGSTPEEKASQIDKLKAAVDKSKQASPDDLTVGEMLQKPVIYKGQRGSIYQDGQSLVFKVEGQNKEYELGNVEEMRDRPLSDFAIENETTVVDVNDQGDVTVRGEVYKNNYSDPLAAINRDEKGNLISVNLETEDGKKRTFRGNIAEDIAYQFHLKEITSSPENTEEFINYINEDEQAQTEIDNGSVSEPSKENAVETPANAPREKIEPITATEPKIDFTGKDNNYLANKEPGFFTPSEREQYNELMKKPETEAQADQMVSDKKARLKNPNEQVKISTEEGSKKIGQEINPENQKPVSESGGQGEQNVLTPKDESIAGADNNAPASLSPLIADRSGNSESQTKNIVTATEILKNSGVDASFSGYSDTNGVSVYFKDKQGRKYRVSDHGVQNKDRIENEILLSFDQKTIGINGDGIKDNQPSNKKEIELLNTNKEEIKIEPKSIAQLASENKSTVPKIPSNKVFLNNVEFPQKEEAEKVDVYFNNNTTSELPTESVSVNKIVPTQKNLNIKNLEDTKEVSNSDDEDIVLLKTNGKYYVLDGHHRIANEILKGNNKIEAHVFDTKKDYRVNYLDNYEVNDVEIPDGIENESDWQEKLVDKAFSDMGLKPSKKTAGTGTLYYTFKDKNGEDIVVRLGDHSKGRWAGREVEANIVYDKNSTPRDILDILRDKLPDGKIVKPQSISTQEENGKADNGVEKTTETSSGDSIKQSKENEEKIVDNIPPLTEEAESIPPKPPSGIIHRATAETREEFGFDPYEKQVITDLELNRRADFFISKGYNVERLMNKLEDGEIPTSLETTILKKYKKVLEDRITVEPSNENILQLKRLVEVSDLSRSDIGRSLRAGRDELGIEDSLGDFFVSEMEVRGVDELTDAERLKVINEFDNINRAKTELENKIKDLEEENNRLKALSEVRDEKIKPKKTSKTSKDYAKERKEITDKIKKKWNDASKDDGMLKSVIIPLPFIKIKQLIAVAPDVKDLMKNLVHEGIDKLDNIINHIYDTLKNDIDGLTKEDIRDIIAGQYSEPKRTKNEIQEQLHNLRLEAKLLKRIEDLENGVIPTSNSQKRIQSEEIKKLRKKIKSLNSNSGSDINTKEPDKLKAIKTQLESKIKTLEEELRTGNFVIKEEKSLELDKEAIDLKDKLIKLRGERNKRLIQEKYANRSLRGKIIGTVGEILNIPRTLMSSLDFSAVLRQGLIPTISHPIIASKAIKEMFLQAVSQKRFDRWLHDLRESDAYKTMEDSGLYVADPHDVRLSTKEEAFMNNWAEKVPIIGESIKIGDKTLIPGIGAIKASERAYVSYLNKMRVDLFANGMSLLESQGKTFKNSPELYKGLASFINNFTGRGDIKGALEKAAPILSATFFAPRLIASRLNILGVSDIIYGGKGFYGSLPKEIRVLALKDMAKFIGFGLSVLALIKYSCPECEVEDDPRNPDFGKIHLGNSRWDIWGGFQQYIVFLTKLLLQQRVTSSDKEVHELDGSGRGITTPAGVILNFLRGKLAPIPSIVTDRLFTRTMTYEPFTWKGEAENHLFPLLYHDVKEAVDEQGAKAFVTVGLPGMFGVGVQTYKDEEKN